MGLHAYMLICVILIKHILSIHLSHDEQTRYFLNFSMPVTKLVYRCNLNYKYCVNLISDMVKDEILEAIEHGSGMRYQITPKGTEYMKNLRNIASVHHVRDV